MNEESYIPSLTLEPAEAVAAEAEAKKAEEAKV